MKRWKRLALLVVAGLGVATLVCAGLFGPCWRAIFTQGVWANRCPAGVVPVATLEASGMGRGVWGHVEVRAMARVFDDGYRPDGEATFVNFDPSLFLVDPDGKEAPLKPEKGWKARGPWQSADVVLDKDLPDGDYTLVARVDTPAGIATVEVPLPLFAPALLHHLTDAPLYKPGQDVRFRAVLLHRGTLAPLVDRPGRWVVTDPDGEVMLEERDETGAFGVADSSFPLADDAPSGTWHVRFVSGDAGAALAFEVRPFQLPRHTVELSASQAVFRRGDFVRVRGVARYTSGAPIAHAPARVRARKADGAWPPPSDWLVERTVTTDAGGAFTVDFGPVPDDLVDQATLSVAASVTEEAGQTAVGGATLQLSQQALVADGVTELADGLVPSANNRLYVRVTTPDGVPLANTAVRLRRAWETDDAGLEATTDEDAVARFQIDPGPPITVVEPQLPARPPPPVTEPVRLTGSEEVGTGWSLSIAELSALDRWRASMAGCAGLVASGTERADVTVLVEGSGSVSQAIGESPLERCLARVARGQRATTGAARVWSLSFEVEDPRSPSLSVTGVHQVGDVGARSLVDERVAAARRCAEGITTARTMGTWLVSTTAGRREVQVRGLEAANPCLAQALSGMMLDEPAESDGILVVAVRASPWSSPDSSPPEPATFPGFEFRIEAAGGPGEGTREAVLRMREGAIPDLRLRFSEVVVDPGAEVEVTALKGPNWSGELPEKLSLRQGDRQLVEVTFDPKKKAGTFKVPGAAAGFASIEYAGARAVMYVRPAARLDLTVATDRDAYRPGETARLTVTSRDGAGPVDAGVTLSGVDSTMATLAPLPGPADLAKIAVLAKSAVPAFGMLDAEALQSGRVRGASAMQATVLRISELPAASPGADRVSGSAASEVDIDTPLAEKFWALYADVRKAERAWEATAPADELLTARKMVELWEETVRKTHALDPFGNPMHLKRLPPDLLAAADPRVVAMDGARLPEDFENWSEFVAENAP